MATNDDEEEHDDGEEHDIFQSIDIIEDEQENDQGDYKVASPLHHEEEIKYQNRKPKWPKYYTRFSEEDFELRNDEP